MEPAGRMGNGQGKNRLNLGLVPSKAADPGIVILRDYWALAEVESIMSTILFVHHNSHLMFPNC